MASWFGTVVGTIGFRSVRTGGVTASIRPARVPFSVFSSVSTSSSSQATATATAATTSGQQRSNLMFFPETPPVSSRRTFWNWRGGDDKKWTFDHDNNNNNNNSYDFVQQLRGGDGSTAHSGGASLLESQDLAEVSPKTYPVSVCSVQGYRSYMEDEFFVGQNGDFAACFDGHGGPAVSRYLRKNLYANVQAVLPLMAPTTSTTASLSSIRLEDEDSTSTSSWTTTRTGTTDPLADTPSVPTPEDYQAALETALEKVDREVQRISHWSYQGSTAVVVWIHEDRRSNTPAEQHGAPPESSSDGSLSNETTPVVSHRTIIAANIGDSRAVLCRNSTAWDLTRDHKPNDPLEKDRIEKLGGKVVWCGDTDKQGEPILERGIYRVNGNLALSRAVGDRSERPHVTADPEIIAIPVRDEDEFIILATDGLWDVLESSEAVDLIQKLVEQGLPRDRVATWMVEESIRRGTYDNVTVVIIWLDRSAAKKSTQ